MHNENQAFDVDKVLAKLTDQKLKDPFAHFASTVDFEY